MTWPYNALRLTHPTHDPPRRHPPEMEPKAFPALDSLNLARVVYQCLPCYFRPDGYGIRPI